MAAVFFLVFSLTGCGSEDVSEPAQKEEVEGLPSEDVEEPETGVEAEENTASQWAPKLEIEEPQDFQVPGKDEVPFPPYPGAYVFDVLGEEKLVIYLLSKDSPEDVFLFYKENLEGWSSEGDPGDIYFSIWDGGPEDGVIGSGVTHLSIGPVREGTEYLEWMPEAKSNFVFSYVELLK